MSLARDRYLASVDEIRESIAAGDVYEVNLTRRHCLAGGPSPWRSRFSRQPQRVPARLSCERPLTPKVSR